MYSEMHARRTGVYSEMHARRTGMFSKIHDVCKVIAFFLAVCNVAQGHYWPGFTFLSYCYMTASDHEEEYFVLIFWCAYCFLVSGYVALQQLFAGVDAVRNSQAAAAVATQCAILTDAIKVAAVPGILCICAACKKYYM